MKKVYIVLFFMLSLFSVKAQILVENHFDGYDGTPASVPQGWYISWNSDTTQTVLSFYTTAGNCGITCPSYKFGLDSVLMISPAFTNADTVRFFLKGNGTQVVENTLELYTSPDSVNWTMAASLDSISPSIVTVSVPIPNTATHIAFLYRKPTLGYNAGVDDIYIHRGTFVTGVKSVEKVTPSFRPNPVNTKVTIDFGTSLAASIRILNIIGKEVMSATMNQPASSYSMNLSSLEEGIYFVRIQSKNQTITKRLVVKH